MSSGAALEAMVSVIAAARRLAEGLASERKTLSIDTAARLRALDAMLDRLDRVALSAMKAEPKP